MKKAKIVIGLGFGDEGKGITTDFLCNEYPEAMVVRFSGGQQAAHTVMYEGKKHVHSSFCSGALRGLPSYFSEHCTIYPSFLYNEQKELEKKNGNTTLYIHPLAKVTTPFDVWHNRNNVKNLSHGSCGKGIGATMKRNEGPYKLYAIDLVAPKPLLIERLKSIANYYGISDSEDLQNEVSYFLQSVAAIDWKIKDYSFLKQYETIIFEGSQGVLLDMNHGVFPNVTYANTTAKNAIEICNKLQIDDIETFYVSRSYVTRHGNGWMLNEEEITLINNEEETCTYNEYQKHLRFGKLNLELLLYAKSIDQIYNPSTKNNIVITCLDQLSENIDMNVLQTNFNTIYGSYSPESKNFKKLTI
ncbi:adenylosuccinate synthetase [Tenacibaculum sp. M341]|uniref:adenylosuccinate synthetase n=1 Tax=Tenacibaculum sp. M341 TaxID=2530339 RepID=UPI00104C0133|nr:adenylosuccinate synthetase [Tenacibaculum sp. M341]TCI95084.1 adenylosuccinate synthetase [Tenacibaculum sp. M341]